MTKICHSKVCEFTLNIQYDRTLVYRDQENGGNAYDVQLNGTKLEIVENSHKQREYDGTIGRYVNSDDVITCDGRKRTIIVINGQFPGPTLEVMEGSQVSVHINVLRKV